MKPSAPHMARGNSSEKEKKDGGWYPFVQSRHKQPNRLKYTPGAAEEHEYNVDEEKNLHAIGMAVPFCQE